ncbi:ABC transporter ATP-binding protein [Actinophytocola oryzae]|uniref:ABC-2 type transport system ATP-binding protein n=1 Tax=Actinophytocola oryzae TaxID=502181 RepID=A0A4R7VJP3_9PSEU|nr:ATP-binding cassette domain-containing protein [Actinophytocola oryzae]TDV49676.1 ABC-2 type transport system ATP-binding protein [Actinophytocola oryzae]
MIELRGLTKRYGAATVVDGLTFGVVPGQVTGFLGPNGAGKSTTLRMVLGLTRPTGGEVLIDGSHYRDLTDPLRQVGALLETRSVHPGRSAHDHLLCLAQSNRIPRGRVAEVLGIVGLESVAGKRAGEFSLGMGQRLGIAAALLGDPPILLFDEPVNGLDPEGIRWIRNLMRQFASEGRTVLVSSHLMAEMALTADHLVVIGGGRLLADTTMAEFTEGNAQGFVRIATPEPRRLLDLLRDSGIAVEQAADGTLSATGADARSISALAADHGVPLDELSTRSASLEEAFMRLTTGTAEFLGGAESREAGRR